MSRKAAIPEKNWQKAKNHLLKILSLSWNSGYA